MRKTNELGRNVIKLESSPDETGNLLADIGASADGKKLMEAIEIAGFSSKEPYFILQEIDGDKWLLKHYSFDRAPPKLQAYLRVWPLYWEPSPAPKSNPLDVEQWRRAERMLLTACETIHEHHHAKGRHPSRDVRAARAILSGFEQIAQNIQKQLRHPKVA